MNLNLKGGKLKKMGYQGEEMENNLNLNYKLGEPNEVGKSRRGEGK